MGSSSLIPVVAITILVSCFAATCHADVEKYKFVVTTSRLPQPLTKHSAVYDGQDTIYIIGGYNEDRVTRFSVADGTVEVISTFLKVHSGAAVMDGEDIVYFGGYISGKARSSSGIYRFSTVHRNFTLANNLPVAMERMALAWDPVGHVAYTFGGVGLGNLDQVLRYRASDDEIEQLALLPERRSGAGAVWDHRQEVAYVFGGEGSRRALGREIFRFNPSAASPIVARVTATLPYAVEWPCAVFANDYVYVVGDRGRLIKFDPKSERVESVAVDGWRRPLTYSACVHVPKQSRIYLIGGYGSFRQGEVKERRDEISYIDLGYPDAVGVNLDTGVGAKLQSNPLFINKVIGS